MAGPTAPDAIPGAGGPPPGMADLMAPPDQAGKGRNEKDKRDFHDKKEPGPNMVPESVAIGLQKDNERLQRENEKLKNQTAENKKQEQRPQPAGRDLNERVNQALEAEGTLPFSKIAGGVLNRTMRKFLGQSLEPGPHAKIGMSQEIRRPNWFKRTFLKIPFLGLLAPAGMVNLPAAAKNITTVGQLAGATGEIISYSVQPALSVGVLGALARGATDAIRRVVMKDKTITLFARELVRRGTNGGRSWDSAAVWNTVFGDKYDISEILDLGNEMKSGITADKLMMDKGELRRLIKRGFASKLEKLTLERLVSSEGLAKLAPGERAHLENVEVAYDVAEKLFSEGLSPAEKAAFIQDELPRYIQQREITNYIKAMGKRVAIAGFKTSAVGMAASLFGTLNKTHLLADWGQKITDTVSAGVTNIKGYATKWLSGAETGLKTWLDTIPWPQQLTLAPAAAGAATFTGQYVSPTIVPTK